MLYLLSFLTLLASLLQSTILGQLTLMGQRLDLVLLLVASCAAVRGPWTGLVLACVGGAALDFLSALPFGSSTIPLIICAVVVGFALRDLSRQYPLLPIVTSPLLAVLYYVLSGIAVSLLGWPLDWGALFGSMIFPAILLDTIVLPFIYVGIYTLLEGRRVKLTWRTSRL